MVCPSIKQSGDLFVCYMTVSKVTWSKYRTDETSDTDSIVLLPLKRRKWLAFFVKKKQKKIPANSISGNYEFVVYESVKANLLKE